MIYREATQAAQAQPIATPTAGKPAASIGVERAFQTLAENLPTYERRQEQYDLTLHIAHALRTETHLVCEAGTGTGKSFAVGLAIISEFLGAGKTTVIATANNNLLEQYAIKDLPFLASLFPGLKWARAKGKNNYACELKASEKFDQTVLFNKTATFSKLLQWYQNTRTGDKAEIKFSVPAEEWAEINCDDSCTGKKCPFYDTCFYYTARESLQTADIVVTNFDIVLLDLFNPIYSLLPAHEALILDEAHQLEDKTISKLEATLSRQEMVRIFAKATREYRVDQSLIIEPHKAMEALFKEYKAFLDNEDKKTIAPYEKLVTLTANFSHSVEFLTNEILRFQPEYEREKKKQKNLVDRMFGITHAAKIAVESNDRTTSWIEKTIREDYRIVTAPFKVARRLHFDLFSEPGKTVITMSATLGTGAPSGGSPKFDANGNRIMDTAAVFEQFRRRCGITEATEFIADSPFDYKKNCALYLPTPPAGIDTPNHKEWKYWAADEILKLVKMSNGRALVLCTSVVNCKFFGDWISKNTSLEVKIQSKETSNSQLIEWFKEKNTVQQGLFGATASGGVLVGTASFWEGVSIEGDLLKLVIIDKIPFAPMNDPIQQARDADYKRRGKEKQAWRDLQVYPAIIKLKQGFGRLIRTKSDQGAVAILDPRLTTKGFGKSILRSLPQATRVNSLEDVFLKEILS